MRVSNALYRTTFVAAYVPLMEDCRLQTKLVHLKLNDVFLLSNFPTTTNLNQAQDIMGQYTYTMQE